MAQDGLQWEEDGAAMATALPFLSSCSAAAGPHILVCDALTNTTTSEPRLGPCVSLAWLMVAHDSDPPGASRDGAKASAVRFRPPRLGADSTVKRGGEILKRVTNGPAECGQWSEACDMGNAHCLMTGQRSQNDVNTHAKKGMNCCHEV
ncbi:hypothetical protein MRX96_039924 [Rhipicephalus microplus]